MQLRYCRLPVMETLFAFCLHKASPLTRLAENSPMLNSKNIKCTFAQVIRVIKRRLLNIPMLKPSFVPVGIE